MTYSIKRVGIKSAAKVAFVCVIIVMFPILTAILLLSESPGFVVEDTSGIWLERLLLTLAVLLLDGLIAAIGASILALVYNLSVRLHGGISLDIELQDAQPPEKKKNGLRLRQLVEEPA